MTTTFFRRATRLAPTPPPVVVAMSAPVVVPVFSRTPSVPEVSPGPKRPDVETIGTSFRFGMQQVTVAVHARSEVPDRFPASLVGGR